MTILRLALRPLVLALCAASLSAQVPGGAFLVDRLGQHAEGNSFPRSDVVFLGAGPRVACGDPASACGEPGLPDGDYVFQVTDPAGRFLLSTGPVAERRVRVVGGVIAQYLGTTRPSAPIGPCGGLIVQVAPFDATPYPTNDYKLWLTRVEDFDRDVPSLFGFVPSKCKTDVFRLGTEADQAILTGHKFYDYDQDGLWNPGAEPLEVPVGDWRIELYKDGVLNGVTYTDQDGKYAFVRERNGREWELREVAPAGFINDATSDATWLATTPRAGAVRADGECVAAPEFGNVHYELVVGLGRTPRFWSDLWSCNRPKEECGPALLADCDPLWRAALNVRGGLPVNLRNPISTDDPLLSIYTVPPPPASFFDAFASWESFAQQAPYDHAGYLLSLEVAATLLSTSCGHIQGPTYVDRFQDGVLVSLDEMLDGAIGLLSMEGAGLTAPGDPYPDLRQLMLNCINEFRTINETADPGAPQVVYQRSTEAPPNEVPY